MNKLLLIPILAVAVVGMMYPAYAQSIHVTAFELTLEIEDVQVIPAPRGTDGSYYLIYGKDSDGLDHVAEIQNNILSLGSNLDDLESLNRDQILRKVQTNIGNTITFECNGAEGFEWMEQYLQCYKIINIIGEENVPTSGVGEQALLNRIAELETQLENRDLLIMEQLKVIQQLAATM
jgi:hypothetical protein